MGSPVSAVIANLYMETFEEQAIESAPSKPKIWKRYMDDTFTILDRDRADIFLQHLYSQQPTIRFTMETENDCQQDRLSRRVSLKTTTSVYRKPTHTDQYLAYDSHHPQTVKHGIVKCLYDRAKRLVTKPSVISTEKKHLSSVLVSNGYPSSFAQKISKARTAPKKEPMAEFKSTAVLPYIQGVSEPLRCCLEQQGIRTIFKSETTLRSHLVRPKDTVARLNKMAWSTGFLVNVEKSMSGKQEDLCMRESKNMTGVYDSPVPRPPPFLSTPTRPAITRFGTR